MKAPLAARICKHVVRKLHHLPSGLWTSRMNEQPAYVHQSFHQGGFLYGFRFKWYFELIVWFLIFHGAARTLIFPRTFKLTQCALIIFEIEMWNARRVFFLTSHLRNCCCTLHSSWHDPPKMHSLLLLLFPWFSSTYLQKKVSDLLYSSIWSGINLEFGL